MQFTLHPLLGRSSCLGNSPSRILSRFFGIIHLALGLRVVIATLYSSFFLRSFSLWLHHGFPRGRLIGLITVKVFSHIFCKFTVGIVSYFHPLCLFLYEILSGGLESPSLGERVFRHFLLMCVIVVLGH